MLGRAYISMAYTGYAAAYNGTSALGTCLSFWEELRS